MISRIETMITAEVAEYLGLSGRASACGWLRRHGIRAVARQPGPRGQNLYPAELVVTRERRESYDRWRDDQGAHVPVGCRVEQVGVYRPHGGARSRLGQRGVVIGRRCSRVHVRFDGGDQPVSLRPYLVRVMPVTTPPGPSIGGIIDQLEELRELLPALAPLGAVPTLRTPPSP